MEIMAFNRGSKVLQGSKFHLAVINIAHRIQDTRRIEDDECDVQRMACLKNSYQSGQIISMPYIWSPRTCFGCISLTAELVALEGRFL